MLDQLRHDIQTRLDELLSEAEKLRHALAALSSRVGATSVLRLKFLRELWYTWLCQELDVPKLFWS